ncbi:hemerythrin family protein [Desulfobacterales bacterium HSG17]|nr:hemerythrin family protein [Desulfobacterales bacterium HSG17]
MTQYNITDWSDDYLIGIEKVDKQHKQFFRLAHNFFTACLADEGDEHTHSALKALGSYADRHFAVEEAYMEEIGYPRLEEHKKLHSEFVLKYNEMEMDFKESGRTETLVNKILTTVMDWLKEHIATADYDYAEFKAGD